MQHKYSTCHTIDVTAVRFDHTGRSTPTRVMIDGASCSVTSSSCGQFVSAYHQGKFYWLTAHGEYTPR